MGRSSMPATSSARAAGSAWRALSTPLSLPLLASPGQRLRLGQRRRQRLLPSCALPTQSSAPRVRCPLTRRRLQHRLQPRHQLRWRLLRHRAQRRSRRLLRRQLPWLRARRLRLRRRVQMRTARWTARDIRNPPSPWARRCSAGARTLAPCARTATAADARRPRGWTGCSASRRSRSSWCRARGGWNWGRGWRLGRLRTVAHATSSPWWRGLRSATSLRRSA